MGYKISFLPKAQDDLSHLDKIEKIQIFARLKWLSEHIQNFYPQMLTGNLRGLFKFRAGDYRIIYEIKNSENLIIIHLIGHRRDIYK